MQYLYSCCPAAAAGATAVAANPHTAAIPIAPPLPFPLLPCCHSTHPYPPHSPLVLVPTPTHSCSFMHIPALVQTPGTHPYSTHSLLVLICTCAYLSVLVPNPTRSCSFVLIPDHLSLFALVCACHHCCCCSCTACCCSSAAAVAVATATSTGGVAAAAARVVPLAGLVGLHLLCA